MINDSIVYTALGFVGQEEISGNLGFKDGEFQELMDAVGWEKGQAWCAYFTELVWKLAFTHDSKIVRELDQLFSAGAVATYNNFRRSSWVTGETPVAGSVVIWQRWKDNKPTWMGHAGIVTDVQPDLMTTVEGNTNYKGEREGLAVLKKTRSFAWNTGNGLRIKGFIQPRKV